MNLKIIFLLLAAVYAGAQTTCPPINFLNAKTVNLDVTDSSHLTLLRQSDGSYTAFEIANTSPYAVLRTIPHFEQQFSNCLLRATSAAPGKASSPAPNAPGLAAQLVAFAVLDSGNYLFVVPVANSLDVAVFDQQLQLVSEKQVGALTGPGDYGQGYVSLVLADMNGDGKSDVVAEYELGLSGEGGGVQVFYGDGSGGFQPAGGFAVAGYIYGSMAVADLNGDGKPDIVVGTGAQPGKLSSSGASLVIALGKDDGTFVTSIFPTQNEGPAAIAIADLNGDGKNDLVYLTSPVTTNMPTLNEVVVALGHGDGTFSPQTVIPVNIASTPAPFGNIGTSGAIAIGDMNGDGIPDIVTNGISILLGDGKAGFPTRKDFLNTAGESVILTDFDGDGKLDVVIGTGNPLVLNALGFIEGTLTVFFGDGAGGLAAAPITPSPIPVTENPSPFSFLVGSVRDASIASGDFNHDGIADLALVTAFQYLTVFLGNSSGTLEPVFSYDFSTVDQAASPTSVAVGDFNADGILDLAVTVARSTIARPVAPGRIMVFLGKGDGTFLAPISSNAPVSIWSLVTGDFNKDAKADLAAINSSGSPAPDQVVVFLGQGDGTFASAQTYPAGVEAAALAAGDFNQDGAADIAIANQAGISLLLGNADGTLVPASVCLSRSTSPRAW